MYRKKRNKRSDAHDVMADKTFKSIVHALRLSNINIPKNALLLPNYQRLSVVARKKIWMELREKMGMTARKNMRMTARKMAESKTIGMLTVTKRMKCSDSRSLMLDTINKLTEPTACSLLDGTVELALAKVFPSQKACHSVPVQDGYVVVQPTYVWANASQYPLPVPIDGGDIATLAEALVQRIQWPKDRIIIPPMTRHTNPEAATGSKGTTSDGGAAAQCQQEKAQQQQQ
jgi:hypothetical protein